MRLIALTNRGDLRRAAAGFDVHLVKPAPHSTVDRMIRALLIA
jgi:hypothetical protein